MADRKLDGLERRIEVLEHQLARSRDGCAPKSILTEYRYRLMQARTLRFRLRK